LVSLAGLAAGSEADGLDAGWLAALLSDFSDLGSDAAGSATAGAGCDAALGADAACAADAAGLLSGSTTGSAVRTLF